MSTPISMGRIISRIPGLLPPPPKTEIDGKLTDLSTKAIPELLELRDRQLKLLNNKPFISKLNDKGAKIKVLYDKIVAEIRSKEEEQQTCQLLERLNLNATKVQDLEWQGKATVNTFLDSDDDSDPEDVMHILSQCRATDKIVRVMKPETTLITLENLEEIGETAHIKYIVNKTENIPKPQNTGKFKPYKTTKTDVHKPEKEILRKKHKYWEVTAATPPPIIHGPVKVLSIEDSLQLQKEQNQNMKLIEATHAAEKLFARSGIMMSRMPDDVVNFGTFRDTISDHSEESDIEGSDKEVHDEEPDKGGVTFTVMK